MLAFSSNWPIFVFFFFFPGWGYAMAVDCLHSIFFHFSCHVTNVLCERDTQNFHSSNDCTLKNSMKKKYIRASHKPLWDTSRPPFEMGCETTSSKRPTAYKFNRDTNQFSNLLLRFFVRCNYFFINFALPTTSQSVVLFVYSNRFVAVLPSYYHFCVPFEFPHLWPKKEKKKIKRNHHQFLFKQNISRNWNKSGNYNSNIKIKSSNETRSHKISLSLILC